MRKTLLATSLAALALAAHSFAGGLESESHSAGGRFDMTGKRSNAGAVNAGAPGGFASNNVPSVPGRPVSPRAERSYLVERVGDVGFLQLYVDGFDQLPADQKLLAYHLSQAALAGRDIAFDQTHRHALEIKDVLQEIVTHGQGVDPAAFQKIRSYFLLFWADHGNYSGQTSKKFIPQFSYDELKEAAGRARQNGAFPGIDAVALDAKLEKLKATIFDPDFEPILVNTAPGQDNVKNSAVNFYRGVTQKEAEAQDAGKPYPLVNRLVKDGNKVIEEVYRAGDPARGLPPGKYAEELGRMIGHLEKAVPYASSPKQKEALEHLIAFFKSGDPADFREYNKAWTHDDSPVDAILGFIETYMDPMGRRAAFEGMISFRDPKFTLVIRSVAGESDYFEKTAPWEAEYKKDKSVPITANAVTMLTQSGDASSGLTLGVNLPNDDQVRSSEGSKNIMISNALESSMGYSGSKETAEFSWTKREVALSRKWAGEAYRLHVALHEVVGHASGKMSEKLAGRQPSEFIKEYFSALEEARAELFGLWAIADPRLKELGLVKSPEVIEQSYRSFVTTGGLVQLKRVPKSEKYTQAHARARNLIVMYLLKKTKAVEAKRRDGKVYLRVKDLKKMRKGVGELLGRLMKIKAEGDYEGAKALFETYGDPINLEWRDQVVSRQKALDMPTRLLPVNARLDPVRGPDGAITDVKVLYPKTMEEAVLGTAGASGKPL